MMVGSKTTPPSPGSLSPQSAQVMVIQKAIPSSSLSTLSSAALISADKAPFCRFYLSAAYVASKCPLLPDATRLLLMKCRNANLPTFPSRHL